MINLSKFLSDLHDAIGWPYCSPGGTSKDCSSSGIDCSGMAVRAYKLQGNSSLYHGCNTMWRDSTFSEKGKLTSVSQLQPGYAVLLNRAWKSTNPSDVKNKWYGDEHGNFTHIGYVLSVSPLTIIDASQSFGAVRQTTTLKKVGWTHYGKFKDVDYGNSETVKKEEESAMTMYVNTANGLPVNVRARTSTTSTLVGTIENGTEVEVANDIVDGSWAKVTMPNGKSGYVLAKFLAAKAETKQTIEERVSSLESLVKRIADKVGVK